MLAWVPPLRGVNWQQVGGKERELFPHTHTQLAPNQFPPPTSPHLRIPALCLSGEEEDGGEGYEVVPGTAPGCPQFHLCLPTAPRKGPERDKPGQ